MKITLLPGDGIGVEIVDAAKLLTQLLKFWTQRLKNITLPLNTIKN